MIYARQCVCVSVCLTYMRAHVAADIQLKGLMLIQLLACDLDPFPREHGPSVAQVIITAMRTHDKSLGIQTEVCMYTCMSGVRIYELIV